MSADTLFQPFRLFVTLTIIGLVLGVIGTLIANLRLLTEAHFYLTVINVGAMWATWLLILVLRAIRKKLF